MSETISSDPYHWHQAAMRLWRKGHSIRRIATLLGKDHESVRGVLCRTGEPVPAFNPNRSRLHQGQVPGDVPPEHSRLWLEIAGKMGAARATPILRAHLAPRVRIAGRPPGGAT